MLIGYVLTGVFVLCTLFSPLFGNAEAAGRAVMEGAEEAVRFCVSVSGGICLWCAVSELMESCGISAAISELLRPVLRRLFPVSAGREDILSALSQNVSANLLGLGNAATPAGIRAAKGMAALGEDKTGDELCMLVVLNTASIQLLPTAIASVRGAAGAARPFDIIPAVWISSACSVCAGLLGAAAMKRLWR